MMDARVKPAHDDRVVQIHRERLWWAMSNDACRLGHILYCLVLYCLALGLGYIGAVLFVGTCVVMWRYYR
jgi:hypothetical protein